MTGILTYSPTGTSQRVAEGVVRGVQLGGEGRQSTARYDVTVTECALPALSGDDLLVIAVPVYGGHIPGVFKRRAAVLSGGGAKAVCVVVYGNRAYEGSLRELVDWAQGHGLTVVGAGAFVGEHSQSTAEHPIGAGRPDASDLSDAEQFGHLVAQRLAEQPAHHAFDIGCLAEHHSKTEHPTRFALRYVAHKLRSLFRPVSERLPTTDVAKCTNCLSCVRGCPLHVIAATPDKRTSAGCNGCHSCERHCPTGARKCPSPLARDLAECFPQRKPNAYVV